MTGGRDDWAQVLAAYHPKPHRSRRNDARRLRMVDGWVLPPPHPGLWLGLALLVTTVAVVALLAAQL